MTEHTSTKSHYAVIIGCRVKFMARPGMTKQKKYRQPMMAEFKRFKNKSEAVMAAKQWEGLLI